MNDTDPTDNTGPAPADSARESARPRARRTGWIVAGIAAAGLGAGILGTVAVTSAVAADPASVVAATAGRIPIPSELRDDIRELIQAAPADRTELFRQILAQAEDGEYGTRAQMMANRIDERLDRLPTQLRADIAEVQAAAVEDRPELRQQIRENAEAGTYGPHVQARLAEIEQALHGTPTQGT